MRKSGPSNDCQLVGARLDGFFGLAVELVSIASVGPGHPAFFLSGATDTTFHHEASFGTVVHDRKSVTVRLSRLQKLNVAG